MATACSTVLTGSASSAACTIAVEPSRHCRYIRRMVWLAVVVQLVVGVATIAVAFRVGTRNAQETANATLQRETAARREEFWKRLTYALTAAGSENQAEAQVGFALLAVLVQSELASSEDRQLARAAGRPVLQPLDPPPDEADTESDECDRSL